MVDSPRKLRKELRLRLASLQSSWPEEDSLRKAWIRQLLAGDWQDKAHDELVARFLQDHEETETEAPGGEAPAGPGWEQRDPGPAPVLMAGSTAAAGPAP